MIVNPTFELVFSTPFEKNKEYVKYRAEWNYFPENFIVRDAPLHLDIELNTTCNFKCPQCFQSFDPPKPEFMDSALYKNIIDEAARIGVRAVKLNYRGEPLLSPILIDAIKHAKKKGILEVMINTNASMLDEEMQEALIKSGLDLMICSLDAIVPETYERIRVGGKFIDTYRNVLSMQVLKLFRKSRKPRVRVQFVQQALNEKEFKSFLKFWRAYADEISVVRQKDYSGVIEDATPLKDWWCAQLWQRLVILADGTVLPCCRAMRGGKHILLNIGNVYEDSIKNIWKCELLETLRSLHREGRSHEVRMCRVCGLRRLMVDGSG